MTEHVLVAIDLTQAEADEKLLKTAADLAQHYGATLSVVTVVPDYGMTIVGTFFKDGTLKKAVQHANDELHAYVDRVLPGHGHVQHIIEVGTVYEQVLDAIQRSKADLVVLGAHKPNLMDKLQGPNSARIARHAPCSVMVIRQD